MKFDRHYRLEEIAAIVQASEFKGDPDHIITGLNLLQLTEAHELTFVDKAKYAAQAQNAAATTVLTNELLPLSDDRAQIITKDPYESFAFLISKFNAFQTTEFSNGNAAYIGANTMIYPGAQVGSRVRIGSNCVIHPNVVLYDGVVIGDDVVINSNSVIGSDGFFFQRRNDGWRKMPSGGGVIIENDVEIGTACSIDRGITSNTVIGVGSKLDNQVHIGHDTTVGAHCLISGCVGISGCATIEDDVVIWGQAGIANSVTIGRGAEILAQSAVLQSVGSNQRFFGAPAIEARTKMKELAMIKELSRYGGRLLQNLQETPSTKAKE